MQEIRKNRGRYRACVVYGLLARAATDCSAHLPHTSRVACVPHHSHLSHTLMKRSVSLSSPAHRPVRQWKRLLEGTKPGLPTPAVSLHPAKN
ncbi:hypothetical protein VPH35_096680 [Triticum aestivum]